MLASLFDLDHTLLIDNSSYRYGSFLYKQHKFPLSSLLYFVGCYGLHKVGKLSLQGLHEKIFVRLFKNLPFDEFRTHAQTFLNENFDAMIYAPALQKLNEAKRKGHVTAILSSSPDFLVKLFAERFEVDEWMATQYVLDKAGKFTAIAEILDGETKVKFMRSIAQQRGIPMEQIIAYSDSYLDLPFLEAAGKAVGVNPDNKLRALCNKHQWEII